MATIYGGKKELTKFLLDNCKFLCEFATNELYESINYFLNQYYTEWEGSYQRSEAFLRSAFKTEIKKRGNGYYAEIGIDYESLNAYENATGYQVVTWANQGLHGGYDAGTNTHVWDDAMASTIYSGQLLADCILFIKGRGLNIVS